MTSMSRILAAFLFVLALVVSPGWSSRDLSHQVRASALVSSPPVEKAPNGDYRSVYPPYFRPDK